MNQQNIYQHKSVLVNEVLEYLDPKPDETYIDVTFGGGGHSRAILTKEPHCNIIAIDWDKNSLEINGPKLQEEFPDRVHLIWGNFANLINLLKKEKLDLQVDGIIADFGTSQYQITELSGFSFLKETTLDMRMSPSHQKLTAQEIINKFSPKALEKIFFELGEEQYTRRIVDAIINERKQYKIKTTLELAEIISKAVPKNFKKKIHPATKVFQALRIYINNELENIKSLLAASLNILNINGRLICISFHSLEDRLIKQFLKDNLCNQKKGFEILTTKVVEASQEEIKINPSSRSAKLRAAKVCYKR